MNSEELFISEKKRELVFHLTQNFRMMSISIVMRTSEIHFFLTDFTVEVLS